MRQRRRLLSGVNKQYAACTQGHRRNKRQSRHSLGRVSQWHASHQPWPQSGSSRRLDKSGVNRHKRQLIDPTHVAPAAQSEMTTTERNATSRVDQRGMQIRKSKRSSQVTRCESTLLFDNTQVRLRREKVDSRTIPLGVPNLTRLR